jgi:ribonuclease BN (tRNA processing enzyme)
VTVTLTFLGTGSASAPGGRSHSAVLVRSAVGIVLLDLGSAAFPPLMRAIDPRDIDAVLVTHLHGDHFGGSPFLILQQGFDRRTRPLVVAGPPALEARLRDLSLALYADFYRDPFPFATPFVRFAEGEHDVAGHAVTAVRVAHSPGSDPFGVRLRIDGKVIAYSGDAEWSAALPALADGADVFICECTTYEQRWPGHLSAVELADRRDELRTPRLVLTHLGPEAVARRADLPYEVAEDGMTIAID